MLESNPGGRARAGDEGSWPSRLRQAALPVVIAAGALYFVHVVGAHYPLHQWLFWRYAVCWLLSIVWSAACVASGHALLLRVLRRTLPIHEHVAVSFAVGVYLFFVAMTATGLAGLYGPALFVALPLAMLAAGARSSIRTAKRLYRHLRYRRKRAAPAPIWAFPVLAFGLLGAGMVYLSILTPENVAFDSRWQHLAIAEHYVAEGAARRFPEGWFIGTSPHLASFVYTWAFLLPKSSLFERVELAAHLEFTAFLFQLISIPALVRLIVPPVAGAERTSGAARRSVLGLSWAARFLFPGIFLYDSSLCAGADHMAALFAVPIFTLLLRAYRRLSPRFCLLLSMMLAGVFLTKYTGAITLLAFPILAVAARAAWLFVAWLRGRAEAGLWYRGPLVATAGCLGLTSPHWAKNWAYYGDPLYPLLRGRLALHPWTPDSSERFEWGFIEGQLWRPERTLAGLKESLKVLLTYSFVPNDWTTFHGAVPVFGSLFTLLLFCLPLLRRTGRLWALFAAGHLGIFCWYWVHHQDRYLQALLPWMAAATAGVIVLVWRSHVAAKIALACLLGLQIVWGGDVYFIPGHAMIKSPIKEVADLLSSGYRRDLKGRDHVFSPFSDVAEALPPKAKVLVHEYHPHLGLGAMSVNDFSVNQGGISYGLLRSPREVDALLRGFGVTHLLWPSDKTKGFDTLASDLLFYDFAKRYGVAPRSFGGFTLAAMPPEPPPDEPPGAALVLVCAGGPAPGLYHVGDLNAPVFGPRKGRYPAPFRPATAADAASLVSEAGYLVVEPRCDLGVSPSAAGGFQLLAQRGKYELWAQRGAGGR